MTALAIVTGAVLLGLAIESAARTIAVAIREARK